LAQIYEGMFVLDNEVVRSSWSTAKKVVTDLIAKHDGTVMTARHWGERKLAYSIKGRSRATYLLTYYSIPPENIPTLIRDLDLSETVLRYLTLKVDLIPEGEAEASAKEDGTEFSLPEPPRDEVGEFKLWEDKDEDAPRRPRREERPQPEATTEAEPAAEAAPAGATSTEEN
jgi:small subunit ribosomal protein S6